MNRTAHRSLCALIVGIVLLSTKPGAAFAHHSLSHFDIREIVAMDTVVTGFRFENPHVIIEGLVPSDSGYRNWIFEAESSLVLKEQGWNSASLKPGDWITVYGNPLKKAERDHLFMDFVRLESGRWMISTPRTFDRYVDDNPDLLQREVAAPSMDIQGTWLRTENPRLELADLPLTEAGQALADRYDPLLDPVQYCLPVGFPRMLIDPRGLRIEATEAGELVFDKELAGVRVAYREGESQPASQFGSAVVNRIDDRYVVESSGFTELAWGTLRGLDSSPQKRVRETYRVGDDGLSLTLDLVIEDPVYLSEPVELTLRYQRVPDYRFAEPPCGEALHSG